MKKSKAEIDAESYSFNTVPSGLNLEEPYLKTGIDSKPEVHPRQEIQMNASFKLNAAARLTASLKIKKKASIMPSNQSGDHDTHISSVEDVEDETE
jgi:hypothetical protein